MKMSWILHLTVLLFIVLGCSRQEEQPAAKNEESSSNPLTAPVDYLGAVVKSKNVAEKVLGTTSIQQAIQTFHAMEGRFPGDLSELVTEKYLSVMPQVPRGMKLIYDSLTGQVKFVRQ